MRRPAHLEHLAHEVVELAFVYSTIFIGVEHAVVDLAHAELRVLCPCVNGEGGEGGPEAGGHRCGGVWVAGPRRWRIWAAPHDS